MKIILTSLCALILPITAQPVQPTQKDPCNCEIDCTTCACEDCKCICCEPITPAETTPPEKEKACCPNDNHKHPEMPVTEISKEKECEVPQAQRPEKSEQTQKPNSGHSCIEPEEKAPAKIAEGGCNKKPEPETEPDTEKEPEPETEPEIEQPEEEQPEEEHHNKEG